MKDRLFLDSDIILDIALRREPHFYASAMVLSLVEKKKIDGFTSSVIISNLYYIIRKLDSHKSAVAFISKLRLLLKILPVDDEIVRLGLESRFKDFEDAIQYFTALTHKIDFLITRNIRDYARSEIKVHSPIEYLKLKDIDTAVTR